MAQLCFAMVASALLLSIFAVVSCHASQHGHGYGGEGDGSKVPRQMLPQEGAAQEIRFEGGSFKIWWRDVPQFPDVSIEVSEISFEEGGLLLPQYADSDCISYVLEGNAKVGIVYPSGGGEPPYMHIKQVEKGDVVGIPKGVVFWWYNDGDSVHRIFSASDSSAGVHPGKYHQFSLVGSREEEFGGLLHGFSRDVLATAWGVDKETMGLLLDSQKGATMVKARHKIDLTDPRFRDRSARLLTANILAEDKSVGELLGEFKYNLGQEYADLYVKRGGWIKAANQAHLPILKLVRMSAIMVSLEKNAVEGPVMFGNAHQVMYVVSGSGKIEVGSNDGRTILRDNVQKGSVLVIPKFLPSMRVSGDEGLTFISFLTSPRPSATYLAGKDSFFGSIPMQVLAESFNMDEETLSVIWESRRHDEAIFPPRLD